MRRLPQQSSMRSIARPRLKVLITGVLLVASLSGCLGDGGQGDPAEVPGGGGSDGGQDGPARGPVTWHIDIAGGEFVRGTLTIQAGDTVEWTNRDLGSHSVTADNGEFDSGRMAGEVPVIDMGDTFEFTFDDMGEYHYHCNFHSSMEDTITVLERFGGVQ